MKLVLMAARANHQFLSHLSGDEVSAIKVDSRFIFLSHLSGDEDRLADSA